MVEVSSLKLYGTWASPCVLRAKLALNIKGIEYEYIEEDLANKSELLSRYNPVYKRVPVLVHNGFPIAESSVILEYIDETWTDPPHLLPKDPYQRSKHRFLAAYFQQDTKPGYLDIIFYSFFVTSDVMEEFFGFKSLSAERYPLLVSWTKALSEVPEVKDVTPSKSKLLELLYAMRQN
ncbi:hypothetical protein BVRB_5g114880 isoform A [Beta vulgaris subsp. vulgaris]|nr:hypothetical protein BVRB_5g114880 isoform A [Beta vulgaris subsp. vulgaris]